MILIRSVTGLTIDVSFLFPRDLSSSNHACFSPFLLCLPVYSNNGHMIKFELFESESSYQCHFAQLGTFVVSIAHYMRAYFNYQALVNGNEFELPGDAGYLNVRTLHALIMLSF